SQVETEERPVPPLAGNDRARVLAVAFGGGDDRAGGGALVHGERAGIADRRAYSGVRLPGALQCAGFDRAARARSAEQRVERVLRGGPFGRTRGTRLRRNELEVGRDDQRRLALHRELVGPLTAQHAAAAARGDQQRAKDDGYDLGGLRHSSNSPRSGPGVARPARSE